MKDAIKILIQKDGATIYHPKDSDTNRFIYHQDGPFVDRLAEFCAETGVSASNVILFISEDQLFVKFFQLPLKTPDLREAINYQLGMLAPFPDDKILQSFKTIRQKEGYRVVLFAARQEPAGAYLFELINSGYRIIGLYPENQCYVTHHNRKLRWALVMPGRFSKVYVFDGITLEDRFLCDSEPEFSELATVCNTETIYQPHPPDGSCFLDTSQLYSKKPVLKEFNLLPPTHMQPDYSKRFMIILAVLNAIALLAVAGMTQFRLETRDRQVTAEINSVMPKVKEVKELHAKNERLKKYIEGIEKLGQNPNIIALLTELTAKLPETSYLDQIRMDKKKNTIQVQGYTDDISELTSKLKDMEGSQLKSTTRRKNKTYFVVEIGLS